MNPLLKNWLAGFYQSPRAAEPLDFGTTLAAEILRLRTLAEKADLWEQAARVLACSVRRFRYGVDKAAGYCQRRATKDLYAESATVFQTHLVETRAGGFIPERGNGWGYVFWLAYNSTVSVIDPQRRLSFVPFIAEMSVYSEQDIIEEAMAREAQDDVLTYLRGQPFATDVVAVQTLCGTITAREAELLLGQQPVAPDTAFASATQPARRRAYAALYLIGEVFDFQRTPTEVASWIPMNPASFVRDYVDPLREELA